MGDVIVKVTRQPVIVNVNAFRGINRIYADSSFGGDGTVNNPLSIIGGAVYADGTTITGDGTQSDPLVAVGGGGGGAVDSVNGQTGVVVLDTGDISEITNKKYVTDAQLTIIGNTSGTNTGDNAANTTSNSYADAKVTDAIVNGVTTVAPSQNAVYDALQLKADTSAIPTALSQLSDDVTHRTVTDTEKATWNALIGGSIFQSVWNATTNTPALTSSVGTKGYYYIVSVAGSTNLDSITDWKIGDWAIFDGTVWRKVDNTDSVSSVNSLTGAVSLDTSNVPDTLNKRYVTDAQLTVLGNTSGTNTGDNATNTQYSGLVSNATHTGEVTGAIALTVDKTAITNKTAVTIDVADYVLISDSSDSGNLKKGLVSDLGGFDDGDFTLVASFKSLYNY